MYIIKRFLLREILGLVSIGATVKLHVVRHVNSCTLLFLNLPYIAYVAKMAL